MASAVTVLVNCFEIELGVCIMLSMSVKFKALSAIEINIQFVTLPVILTTKTEDGYNNELLFRLATEPHIYMGIETSVLAANKATRICLSSNWNLKFC